MKEVTFELDLEIRAVGGGRGKKEVYSSAEGKVKASVAGWHEERTQWVAARGWSGKGLDVRFRFRAKRTSEHSTTAGT